MTNAILSCDSESMSSSSVSHVYLRGTLSKCTSIPSAISPIATAIPPAQKSLHFFIYCVNSGLSTNRWSLRSSGAFHFCTCAHSCSWDATHCAFEETFAPPTPSRHVFHTMITISHFFGGSRRIFLLGAPATTYPHSNLFATYPG